MILNYDDVKEKPETLRAMTSLNRDEFELLCLSFSQAWEEETQSCQRDPSKGGRKPILTKHEDRLLFILFYLKTYPLQEVLAHLFGMSQGQAHFLIYQLSRILRETLKRMDHLPARTSEEMIRKLAEEEPQDFAIDGTERRIQRPKDPDRQKRFFSGKEGEHTVKNVIVSGLLDQQVKYLSPTQEGRKHDKKSQMKNTLRLLKAAIFIKIRFQGFTLPEVTIHQPKKKSKGEQLSLGDKIINRIISRTRVGVEHVIAGVKRLHIVQNVFRNTQDNYEDHVMELACGLHNFRSNHRLCY
ncbi:MAG: transposase [Candidatus Competibacteraceae bacterium]|nr:transposase [Candidatus Competibacteraceae bacterium]